jgi:non-ribosomal peptide synthase protein (TIGR01720 family)
LLLQEVPKAYNTHINDVLLTALVQTFADWTGRRSLLLDLEGHGREELFDGVDLSRTVGWFTTIFPVLLELKADVDSHPGDALKSVKEQLRGIPNRGIGYGMLRYLRQDSETRHKLESFPQAEVSFNYLGQLGQFVSIPPLLGLASGPGGFQRPDGQSINHSPSETRKYLLEVNGFVSDGVLQMDWIYSENIHRRSTVVDLAQGFIEALESLITHCQSSKAIGYTPSDFPDVQLNQEELDQILDEIEIDDMEE